MKHVRSAAAALLALALTLSLVPVRAAERGSLHFVEIVAPQYEDAGYFDENAGLAPVKKDGKWGFIDVEGGVAIPFSYDLAYFFSEGKAVVGTASDGAVQMGFVDAQGNYTPFRALTGEPVCVQPSGGRLIGCAADGNSIFFHNGFAFFGAAEGSVRLYRADGSEVAVQDTSPDGVYVGAPDVTAPMNEGLAPFVSRETGTAGWLDEDGRIVCCFPRASGVYIKEVGPFHQGCALVTQALSSGGVCRYGVMDRAFNWVIRPQYENYWSNTWTGQVFGTTGLAMLQQKGRYGAVDKTGKAVIPFEYENLMPVHDGYIAFCQNGVWGYLDAASNQPAIAPQYVKASSFCDGLAVAYDGTSAFLIDKTGGRVPGADALEPSAYFKVNENGSVSIVPPGKYVIIERDGLYGFGRVDYTPPLPAEAEMDGWAYGEVVAAITNDLVPVSLQNLYRSSITREEFCALVMQTVCRASGMEPEELVLSITGNTLQSCQDSRPFRDTNDRTVLAAYAVGIVNGRGDRVFDPCSNVSRQEAAAFLQRAARVLGIDTENAPDAGFTDGDQVAPYFIDAVNFVYHRHVMNGTDGGAFSPHGEYTREQSFMTAYRLLLALESAQNG
ncbi:MAG: WG repeat-containing protein [Oscillospiraceae bacterium]|nr:WG repeat-containing protein [Oscillospiraceae bacterium]